MAYTGLNCKVLMMASWKKHTELYGNGDDSGIKALEKELLAQNAKHKDWECTEDLMNKTAGGKALYMHCLPADITGPGRSRCELARPCILWSAVRKVK